MSRAVMQQALEALEIGYDSAKAEADQFHSAMAGYKPQRHAQMDADVQTIAKAITALKQALAEPEQKAKPITADEMSAWVKDTWEKCQTEAWQEPVAWMQEMPISGNEERSVRMTTVKMVADEWDNPIPLYTAPTPRKPLTDEEIDRVTDQQWAQNNHKPIYAAHRAYARAIERKHGIGEQV